MNALLEIGLTNALAATALAVLAAFVGRTVRRPALSHALWLLVLIKLITPPLVCIPIELPKSPEQPSSPMSVEEVAQVPVVEAPIAPPREAERDVPPVDTGTNPVGPPDGPALVEPMVVLKSPTLPAPQDAAPAPIGDEVERDKVIAAVAVVQPVSLPTPDAEPIPVESDWTLPEVPWLQLATCAWLAGSVLWFSVALARIRRFQRALADSVPAPAHLQREASELAARMGLADCPGVWLLPGVLSPLLWAIMGYPKLLLPAGLLDRLDPVQRRTLLAHELAHYCRRDHWVRCLEFVALGLYWWCPVAWWARRELREAEEECCDAWVIWTLPRAAKAYASALVETLDYLSGTRSCCLRWLAGWANLTSCEGD